jgi:dihydrodipicolinate synthase/N-acetylneuraminate lyase
MARDPMTTGEAGALIGSRGPLRGTLAAAVTPLRDGGERLDETAFGPLIDFLVAGGLDGILALGTTGEGIMFDREERERALELFLQASRGRLRIAAHCGAQTTRTTMALAEHAAGAGADAVACIGPPYYAFDHEELLEHFTAAAAACAPLPFYVYEFAPRSGYAVPTDVLLRLRETAPNFVGMKVSDTPFDRFEPYLIEDLDVLVGPEALILPGLERGAVGAVSGLATAFPELVSRLVRTRDDHVAEHVTWLRETIQRFPTFGALKAALGMRGIPVGPDCRRPLRGLFEDERAELAAALGELGVVDPAQS